jgi:flagellar M-ring protein FliF
VHVARLLLASQGLPKATASGFEMMQEDPGLGVSTFLEGARYNHALETELARSIALLAPVKAARVHLAIPKPSAFARPDAGASASVLVNLYPGRELEAGQVEAIVHMVASSVAGLKTERVTVVDQFGRLKSGQDEDALAISTEQFDYTRRVEADYARRIEQLLAPITGAGRISTQVAAELDYSQTEEARERYEPDRAVLRSETTSEQTTRGPAGPQGVPGALTNQPPQAQPALPLNALAGQNEAQGPVNESRNATRSFEVDRTLSHTRLPMGRLKKLTVAVLVDDLSRPDGKGGSTIKPLTAEELARIESLVRDAVGFDAARGDRVTVQNVSFLPTETLEPVADLPIWMQPQVQNLLRHGFGLLAIVVLVFAALRPALKVLLAPSPQPVSLDSPVGMIAHHPDGAAPGTGKGRSRQDQVLQADEEEDTPEPFEVSGPYEKKLQSARNAVAQDPKRVAQVVKSWLAEDVGAN